MLNKQQGTSRAFMVEDDAPKRRKFTRKTTSKTGQDGGHSGDPGLLYDDSLYLQDELVKSLDSIVKTLENISNESNKKEKVLGLAAKARIKELIASANSLPGKR